MPSQFHVTEIGPQAVVGSQLVVVIISFNGVGHVPELPVLGTAGIVGALAIGLVVQVRRKNSGL
jgi:hypothetical protein